MENNELFQIMGLDPEKIKTPDDFRTAVNAEFVRRSEAHNDEDITKKIMGKRMGEAQKYFIKSVADLGVELSDEDLKDAKYISDVMKIGMAKLSEHHNQTVNGLKDLASKKGAEAAKEWQEKYEKADKARGDFEGLNKSLIQQLQEKEAWAKNEVKSFRINDAKNKAFANAVFKDGLTDLEKTGFSTIFNSKYEIDLDDKDQPFIFEKETKKRIENKAVVGTFMGIDDVLKMEIEANKLGKVNTQDHKKPVVNNPFPNPNNNNNGEKKGLKISPAFSNPNR